MPAFFPMPQENSDNDQFEILRYSHARSMKIEIQKDEQWSQACQA